MNGPSPQGTESSGDCSCLRLAPVEGVLVLLLVLDPMGALVVAGRILRLEYEYEYRPAG